VRQPALPHCQCSTAQPLLHPNLVDIINRPETSSHVKLYLLYTSTPKLVCKFNFFPYSNDYYIFIYHKASSKTIPLPTTKERFNIQNIQHALRSIKGGPKPLHLLIPNHSGNVKPSISTGTSNPHRLSVISTKKLKNDTSHNRCERFSDGEISTRYNAIDRHVEAGNGDCVAIIWISQLQRQGTGTSIDSSRARLRFCRHSERM
jgi:hypothetical protein